ncbi:MAG: RNA methyltransferase [Myxococcota bacterium]|nr:RNA methyltransferase [Myxococcota bacterium]MDW8362242.1 RNA methyltransferase [Myxococcales bacterium]
MRRDDPACREPAPRRALPAPPSRIVQVLGPLLTPRRLERIRTSIAARTRGVVLVLEDFADPHNASAVLRSAEAFGVLEVHVVDPARRFRVAQRVSRGVDRWLEIERHTEPETPIEALRARGYRIVLAEPAGARSPQQVREWPRVALVLGNEHRGPSDWMRAHADATCAIPMRGLVESLNVSVAAAVLLFALMHDRPGDLSEAEREELLARYLLDDVRDAERLVLGAAAASRADEAG